MENYKLPKNIRQIGGREERIRIYLEDYVNTYIHRFWQDGDENVKGGVLLGEQVSMNGSKNLFIRGAIAVDDPLWKNKRGQDGLKEKIRLYFPDLEVCGWFVCDGGDKVPELQLIKIFEEHFREDGQVLFRMRGADEDFYAQDSSEGLHKLEGYYIYYERNDQMQEYMIAQQPPCSTSEEERTQNRKLEMAREPAENVARKLLAARRIGTGSRSQPAGKDLGRANPEERRHKLADEKKKKVKEKQTKQTKQAGQQAAATQSPRKKKSGGKLGMADILIRVGSLAAIFLIAFFIFTNQAKIGNENEQQTEQVNMVQASAAALTASDSNQLQNSSQRSTASDSGTEGSSTAESGTEKSSATSGLASGDRKTSGNVLGSTTGTTSGTESESSSIAGSNRTLGSTAGSNKTSGNVTGSTDESASRTGESSKSTSSISSADGQASALVGGKGNSNAVDIEENTTESTTEAAQSAAANASVPSSYTILKGESLMSISKKFYGTTDMVEKICILNGISNSDYIQAGETIRLP